MKNNLLSSAVVFTLICLSGGCAVMHHASQKSDVLPVRSCYDTAEGRAELQRFSVSRHVTGEMTPVPSLSSQETLEDALAQAMAYNKRLKVSVYAEEAARQRYIRAKRAFYPSASANLAYGPKHQFREGSGDADLRERNAAVSVTQDIWTGGRHRYDRLREKHHLTDTRFQRHAAIRTLAAEVTETYMRLYVARMTRTLFERSKRAVEKILRSEKSLYRSGYGTVTDIARAAAGLADIEAKTKESHGNQAIHSAMYQRLTGKIAGDDTAIVLPRVATRPSSAAKAGALALRCHPDVSAARAAVKAAEADIKRQKAELWPSLQLEASASYRKGADIFSRGEIREEALSANLNIPLFNKGIEYTAIHEARAEHARLQALAEETELALYSDVIELFHRTATAESVMRARGAGEDAAQAVFEGVTKERRHGRRSAEDVLEAETALLEARIAMLRAQSAYITSAKQLEFLTRGYGESVCEG